MNIYKLRSKLLSHISGDLSDHVFLCCHCPYNLNMYTPPQIWYFLGPCPIPAQLAVGT